MILQNIQAAIVVALGMDVHLTAGVGKIWHMKFLGSTQPTRDTAGQSQFNLSVSIFQLRIISLASHLLAIESKYISCFKAFRV